jgi:dihydrodipicolinate synthase/N-acetylneuraminate lyase
MSRVFALPPGIIASSMTPFDEDGRPKLNAIRPHIDWLIDQGVAGISPIGTAGEFFAIEANDRKAVIEAVMKANNGRVPVVAETHLVRPVLAYFKDSADFSGIDFSTSVRMAGAWASTL